jgi:hypothetical protein
MKRSASCIAVVVLMAAAPLAAQQSLGDVAGSIRLNHPSGEPIVIDHNTVKSAGRPTAVRTDVAFFRGTVDDCLTETRALYGLVMEARGGTSFYRDEWRSRVAEVGLRLDGAREGLAMVQTGGRYPEVYATAEQGSDAAGAALEIMRSAIADDRPVFSEATTLSMEAIRLFEDAQTAIGVASRADAVEATPGLINPIDADRDMTALCGGRYLESSSGFEGCVAEQRSALEALTARSAPAVGLAAVDFNMIRNSCRAEWPGNYVNQNQCEQRRIAARKSL